MGRRKCDLSQVPMLAEQGMTRAEIAKAIGASMSTVYQHIKANGIPVLHASAKHHGLAGKARAENMSAMYRQGLTLEKIGSQFGLTRERVRQILRGRGVAKSDSQRPKMTALKRRQRAAIREARCLEKYGHSLDVMDQLRKDGVLTAFRAQRSAAKLRGIEWTLDFPTWLAIWQMSGKLHLRGRGIGKYVMSRVRDDGGYELGNVHIQLATENNREGVEKGRATTARNTGVYMLYPGSHRPWTARVSRKFLGNFETEQEAVAAREKYLRENPSKTSGRGYATLKRGNGRHTYYQVMVGKKYIGTYKTPDDALAARAAALATKEAA